MANEFEKNVRTNLDGLKLSPSDSVWEEVEKRLNTRKKRRIVLWWIFLPGLFLLSGGIYYYHHHTITQVESLVASQSSRPDTGSVTTPTLATGKAETLESSLPPKSDSLQLETDKPVSGKIAHKKTSSDTQINNVQYVAIPSEKRKEIVAASVDHNESKLVSPGIANGNPVTLQKEENAEKGSGITRLNTSIIESVLSPREIDPALIHLHLPPKHLLVTQSDAPAGDKIAPEIKGWQFGLVFTPGFSFLTESSLKSSAIPNDPAFVDPGTMTNQWGTPSQISTTPDYSGGFSLTTGITVSRQLNKILSISSGLSYKYADINGRTSVFDRATNVITVSRFKNKFHFMELPVRLGAQSHLGSVVATWNAGLSFSYLVSAASFQASGLYSKDIRAFNRLQTGIQTGVDFRLLNSGKFSLVIGPYYQYSFTNMASSGFLLNHHLHFAGIKTGITFKKKD